MNYIEFPMYNACLTIRVNGFGGERRYTAHVTIPPTFSAVFDEESDIIE